ncbi:peptidoglycan amidohydrolase family protein [Leuconostoc pseudomesenteroides]|uniref:peptidoglycan amidohydrolase family protein n=1 Tax=Leuconostoc pseudomesenteroides TaxID=33968 RepID=UPI00228559CC|nr:peptidoglycan amidohydrolase family protein [Leuconostoc pseudomesenteroides]WAM37820.1 hypothetical protein OYT93_06325 [Leuconostoc pseudomesenteroides]
MAIDLNKLVAWFDNHKGKLTYSMTGSRNGSDGTADCSGSVTQAVYEAGASKYAYLYNTVTLGGYLQANGFKRISVNQTWDAKRGDVILMSFGNDMASSGGAGGHTGVMKSATQFISCDYSTGGQQGTAISEHPWNEYYSYNHFSYIEVWRYPTSDSDDTKPTLEGEQDMLLFKADKDHKYGKAADIFLLANQTVIHLDSGDTLNTLKAAGVPYATFTVMNTESLISANGGVK